jgi:hypothetical protein
VCPSTPQVEAALADARRAETKQQLDAQLLPAVIAFAQRKQAGSVHLQQQRFAEAAVEYRGALKAMAELLEKLPAADANPLRDQLVRLQRAMEGELAQAVRALPQTGEGAALPARATWNDREVSIWPAEWYRCSSTRVNVSRICMRQEAGRRAYMAGAGRWALWCTYGVALGTECREHYCSYIDDSYRSTVLPPMDLQARLNCYHGVYTVPKRTV